jgi:hypothetical protein
LAQIIVWGRAFKFGHHSLRGDNSKRVFKKKKKDFENLPQNQLANSNQTWLHANCLWMKGIKVFSKEELGPPQRGDIRKIGWGHLKIFFLRTNRSEMIKFT